MNASTLFAHAFRTPSIANVLGASVPSVEHACIQDLNEDRIVFLEREGLGFLIAVFDGHSGSELSEFTSRELPVQLLSRIEKAREQGVTLSDAVPVSLVEGIRDFDQSLLSYALEEFPFDFPSEGEEWNDEEWSNIPSIHARIKEDHRLERRRALLGSTALVGFFDCAMENVWVASLGDSEAGLGRMLPDGTLSVIRLNKFHNASDPREIERLGALAKQVQEPEIIRNHRVLGFISITRSLGDFEIKLPFSLSNILGYAYYPSPIPLEGAMQNGFAGKAPYISNIAEVRHQCLEKGDVFVMFSDGLTAALKKRKTINGKQVGGRESTDEALHFALENVLEQSAAGPSKVQNNAALKVVDSATENGKSLIDDISVLVVNV